MKTFDTYLTFINRIEKGTGEGSYYKTGTEEKTVKVVDSKTGTKYRTKSEELVSARYIHCTAHRTLHNTVLMYILYTACCTLHYTLHTALHSTLQTAHCTALHITYCTLYHIRYTLHAAHWTLYNTHWLLNIVFCMQHTGYYYTFHSMHYTLRNIHCTLNNAHKKLHFGAVPNIQLYEDSTRRALVKCRKVQCFAIAVQQSYIDVLHATYQS